MRSPGPDDGLSNHPESGQTYEQFVHSRPDRPDARRNHLYLQPLGDFCELDCPPLGQLSDFAAAFFRVDVKVFADLGSFSERNREPPSSLYRRPAVAHHKHFEIASAASSRRLLCLAWDYDG